MKKQFLSLFFSKYATNQSVGGTFSKFEAFVPTNGAYIVSQRSNTRIWGTLNSVADDICQRMVENPDCVVGYWQNESGAYEVDTNHVLCISHWSKDNALYIAQYEQQKAFGLLMPDGSFHEFKLK